ncbi:hypothetical protein NDU88_001321 [Pleurodeles waltl]|uniref:Uncharacterized protein n=1 Tax=Pleurodeles waltl TaxID=8319 RepID=A0AAV7VZ28_PLEWA|nr:hypothetical protein NDU88_001321 [Pleurodeles waltl]
MAALQYRAKVLKRPKTAKSSSKQCRPRHPPARSGPRPKLSGLPTRLSARRPSAGPPSPGAQSPATPDGASASNHGGPLTPRRAPNQGPPASHLQAGAAPPPTAPLPGQSRPSRTGHVTACPLTARPHTPGPGPCKSLSGGPRPEETAEVPARQHSPRVPLRRDSEAPSRAPAEVGGNPCGRAGPRRQARLRPTPPRAALTQDRLQPKPGDR